MQEEIKRREEDPTDMEILEDCLFDIIDSIVTRQEKEDKAIRRAEKKALQDTYTPLCKGYRMKELPSIENEDGEIEREVTDLEFADMIIGPNGHMLSLKTPPGFWEKHKKERDEREREELEKRMIEEAEKNKPLKDKARIILALARNDPKEAAKKVYRGMKEVALKPIKHLSIKQNRRELTLKSKAFLIKSMKDLIEASKTPKSTSIRLANKLYDFYRKTFFIEEEEDPNAAELEAILNSIEGKKKSNRNRSECRNRRTKAFTSLESFST
jgi:hypothetical protein